MGAAHGPECVVWDYDDPEDMPPPEEPDPTEAAP